MEYQSTPTGSLTTSNNLLHYSSHFKVVICEPCGFAIQPNAITQHLKAKHKVYRADRETTLREIAAWTLLQPAEVVYPRESMTAVPMIEVLDGFHCAHQGCEFLCVAAKTMRRHSVVVHGVACPESALLSVHLQTLFRGSQVRYFRVSSGNTQATTTPQNPCHAPPTSRSLSSQIAFSHLDPSLQFVSPAIHDTLQLGQYEESARTLLSHYLTQTCYTLRHSGPVAYYTQLLPQLLDRCKYLKHGIFAVAAMHLAILHEQNNSYTTRYYQMAALHLSESLPLYRAAVDAADQSNIEYIIAYSNCLMIARCANLRLTYGRTLNSPPGSNSALRKAEAWEDLLSYVRITWGNTQAARSVLQHADRDQHLSWVLPQHYPRPLGIQVYTEPLTRLRSSFETCEKGVEDILQHAFDVLLDSYVAGYDPDPARTFDGILTWTSGMSREYIGLLERRQSHALALLAHFSVLMKPLQSYWWLADHGKIMLKAIMDISPGPEDSLVVWPWQQLYS